MKRRSQWLLIVLICVCLPVLMGQMYYYYSTYWGMLESSAPTSMSNAGHIYVDTNNDLRYQDEAGTSAWLMESTTDGAYTLENNLTVGQIGIGTTEPGQKLDINAGNIGFSTSGSYGLK